MKIAVVGAGAMGSLFGGLLGQAGHDVCLVDLWEEHIQKIREEGLVIQGPGFQHNIPLQATTDITCIGKADMILFFVKAYSTMAAIKDVQSIIGEQTYILTLQNGIGNVEIISSVVGCERVIGGTTSYGATMVRPGCVYYGGTGETHIGELSGVVSNRLEFLAKVLNDAGICTAITNNVVGMMWGKLIVNVGINALTAIAAVKNGQLLELAELEELMEYAVAEALCVVQAQQILLPAKNYQAIVKTVAQKTRLNTSSMLQDIQNGRCTEIDYINGAIVTVGKKLRIQTPVNYVLTMLVKTLEKKHTG